MQQTYEYFRVFGEENINKSRNAENEIDRKNWEEIKKTQITLFKKEKDI